MTFCGAAIAAMQPPHYGIIPCTYTTYTTFNVKNNSGVKLEWTYHQSDLTLYITLTDEGIEEQQAKDDEIRKLKAQIEHLKDNRTRDTEWVDCEDEEAEEEEDEAKVNDDDA